MKYVPYDELKGPDLDAARWDQARLPLPTGDEHLALDPNAKLRFSVSHDEFQAADSVKYLALSTRQFELPPDRPAMFAADLAVENIDGEPGDYRWGIAAFQVADLEVSKRVFSVTGTSTRVFAMHEHLPLGGGGPGEPFIYVIESPYEDFGDDFTRLRACEIKLDRSRSTAAWHVDGRKLYEAHGILIPERARIAFGIYTQLPIRDGRSRSLDGQGLNAVAPVPCSRCRRLSRRRPCRLLLCANCERLDRTIQTRGWDEQQERRFRLLLLDEGSRL
jgi:hypothetical protein